MLCVCGCLFVTDKRQNICRTTCHVTDPRLDAQNHKKFVSNFFCYCIISYKEKMLTKVKNKEPSNVYYICNINI